MSDHHQQPPPPYEESSASSQSTLPAIVSAEDIATCQRRLGVLDASLRQAIDAGDETGASRFAALAAQSRSHLNTLQQKFDEQKSLRDEESQWIAAQLNKVREVQEILEEQKHELALTQQQLRRLILETHSRPSQSPQSGARRRQEPSFLSSVESFFGGSSQSHPSHSQSHNNARRQQQQQQQPPPMDALTMISRARHSIKVCQVTLERATLKIDSIDMTSHPSSQHEHRAQLTAQNPSSSLLSIKAVRKDTIARIQRDLEHADNFAKHLDAFEQFCNFLQPPPQSSHQHQQQPQSRNHHRGSSAMDTR